MSLNKEDLSDTYVERHGRLLNALDTLQEGDQIRFATVYKQKASVIKIRRSEDVMRITAEGPGSSDRQYKLVINQDTMERKITSRKGNEKFTSHTAEFNWISIKYDDRDGEIKIGHRDGMKGTSRARKLQGS